MPMFRGILLALLPSLGLWGAAAWIVKPQSGGGGASVAAPAPPVAPAGQKSAVKLAASG